MKNIFIILLLTISFSLLAMSQTELWRLPGFFNIAVKGDTGNLYLTHGGWPYYNYWQDTIKKVDSTGTILKEVPISVNVPFMLNNGNGLYVLLHNTTNEDSIVYLDKDLNLIWSKRFTNNYFPSYHHRPVLDKMVIFIS